jgi:hypothetical protein
VTNDCPKSASIKDYGLKTVEVGLEQFLKCEDRRQAMEAESLSTE